MGHEVTAETRQRIAEATRGNQRGRGNRGKKRTDQERVQISAERNPGWKGDAALYRAVHNWLDRWFGHEKSECEECGRDDCRLEWAFKGENGEHRRDRSLYKVLCTGCHRTFDRSKA